MEKSTLLLLLALFGSARGYLIKVPTDPVIQPRVAPVGWVHMQKLLLPLFENICEQSKDAVVVKLSQDFVLDTTSESYTNPEIIRNVLDLKSGKGFVPKHEIFTEYNIDHLNEVKIIYELLYYANNFDAFYKAACWARQNINCGLYIDALYSAILNRKDTQYIFLPAPYEILPNYFIRKDFIIRASSLMAGEEITQSESIRNDGNSYILDVNYTTQTLDRTDDSKLSYFYEDIGLNSYYYFTKLKMSSWINSNTESNMNGEYLFFLMKQLMARYNLERYSNGLPEVESIDWDNLNTMPHYDPMLVYSDGDDFSHRPFTLIENTEKLSLLKNIENNVATIVTHMREGGFNKSVILNHLMNILIISDKSYESLALQLLNDNSIINKRPPSVLGHYMTTVRDPAFWAINKKIVDIVDKALKVLPGYTRNELYFPGVEIINVDVKKMMTSFDNFVFDVTDALKADENDTKFKVKISQSRLTHKPFSIKINITSLVSQKGLLRIYLGPKIMPGEHALKKNLFMILDCSEVNLKFGSNIITRTSADISNNSDDLLSLYTIRKKLADAEFGLDSTAKLKSIDEQTKFPSRLVIPKGLSEGLPLQIFVFVVPLGKALSRQLIGTDIKKDALLSPGFPLDLDVELEKLFDLPNALVKDIIVTHKESVDSTINYSGKSSGRSWQYNDFQEVNEPVSLPLAARPDFTKRKEPYDYKSKRGQYGNKEDYASKKNENKYIKDFSRLVDKTIKVNDENYVTKTDMTTNKIITYIPENVININDIVVTTDKLFDKENTFVLDKKIRDQGINEEVQIVVTDKASADLDKILHKYGTYGKTISDKNTKYSDEVIWENANKQKTIDVTNDRKLFSDVSFELSDDDTNIIDNVDVSKSTQKNNRFPTTFDIVFNPLYDYNKLDEKVYE